MWMTDRLQCPVILDVLLNCHSLTCKCKLCVCGFFSYGSALQNSFVLYVVEQVTTLKYLVTTATLITAF